MDSKLFNMTILFPQRNNFTSVSVISITCLLTLLLFITIPPCALSANQQEDGNSTPPLKIIFDGAASESLIPLSQKRKIWRGRDGKGILSRTIGIHSEVKQRKQLKKGRRISLNLFHDRSVMGVVDQSITDINGITITSAKIENSDFGRIFIASNGETVRAKVAIPEEKRFYAIHHNSEEDTHYALELDPERVQYDGQGILPPGASPGEPLWLSLPQVADPGESKDTVTVDVMVVYSRDALSDAGGESGINNLISLGMAHANDAHSNTQSGIHLNLVYSGLVDYDGTNNKNTDLSRLTNKNDGYLDEVHTLRDEHGADFVVLLVGNYSSDGGIAWILQSASGSPSYAFSVVTEPAFDSYTTVHEIGHNMGLAHAKDQSFQPGPTNWWSDPHGFGESSAGWHWHPTPGSRGYCSIMTYTGGSYFPDGLSHTRVGIFSDPDIIDHGMPAGHSSDGNNSRVLRTLKQVYAAYRDRPEIPKSISLDYPAGGEIFGAGSAFFIRWSSTGLSGNVKLDLLENGSLRQQLSSGTPYDSLFYWVIPSDLNGAKFSIRISDEEGDVFTVSDRFTINPYEIETENKLCFPIRSTDGQTSLICM